MGIRVASLNVWALPANLSRHESVRMEAIAAALVDLAPDLLAFQEVWTEASRETLVAGARAAGLEALWYPESATGSSGLLIASRYPIDKILFEPYDARGFPERIQHSDYWGGKGFAIARVTTPEGALAFANTHLHANYAPPGRPDEYVGVRTAQIVEFAAGLHWAGELPVIAAGDFNLVESEAGYRILRGLTGLRDVAVILDRRQATTRLGNPYRAPNAADKRIDYLLERPGRLRHFAPKRIERAFDAPLEFDGRPGNYSDHAGLLAEFEAIPRTGVGRLPAADPGSIAQARRLVEEGRAQSLGRRRRQRGFAGAALLGAAAGAAGLYATRTTRRRFLRGGLAAATALNVGFGLEQSWLSEWMHPEEAAGFDTAEILLNHFRVEG